MIQAQRPIQALIAELANLLDTEIKILDLRCRQMTAMRQYIADRNDNALGNLLAEIEETREFQLISERDLMAMRNDLAVALSYPGPGRMRLSWMIPQLEGNQRTMIEYRRKQIIDLTAQLRHEHSYTSTLLRECMRINRMLLEGMFPSDETMTTYCAGGRTSWQPQTRLVDTEL